MKQKKESYFISLIRIGVSFIISLAIPIIAIGGLGGAIYGIIRLTEVLVFEIPNNVSTVTDLGYIIGSYGLTDLRYIIGFYGLWGVFGISGLPRIYYILKEWGW
jgi:hypothetical protein